MAPPVDRIATAFLTTGAVPAHEDRLRDLRALRIVNLPTRRRRHWHWVWAVFSAAAAGLAAYVAVTEKPLDWFKERITQSQIFGAFIVQELVGVVGLRAHDDAKQRHKAMLWGMYVRREARQYGIGERLVDAAVAHAAGHIEQLQLAVVTENEAARRLYAKAGFIEYGHQINALKQNGRYYDDILMVKFLRP